MAPKAKTWKDLDAIRNRRGYVPSKDSDLDHSPVYKPIVPGTEDEYENALSIWDRYSALYPDRTPTKIGDYKDFIKWHAASVTGLFDPVNNLAAPSTIEGFRRCFTAGWRRRNHQDIPKDVNDTIKNSIKSGLDGLLSFSVEERHHGHLPIEDIRLLAFQLMGRDYHDFVHERYRFQMLASWGLLACFRLGELYQSTTKRKPNSGLRYGDMDFILQRVDGSETPQYIVNPKRAFMKGCTNKPKKQIEHTFYEVLEDRADQLWLDSVFLLLVVALRDEVFEDIHTFQQLLDRRVPEGRSCETLRQRATAKLLPVFRQCAENGVTGSIQCSSNYSAQFRDLGHRAGIPANIKSYDFRREMLILIEGAGYSEADRMQFSGHTNADVFRSYYKGNHCLVDSRAVMVGTAPQTSHLSNVRGYQRSIQPFRRSLTAGDTRRLDSQMTELDANDGKRSYDKYRRLKRAARAGFRQSPANATTPAPKDVSLDDFVFTKKLMPEREFLAGALFQPATMRSDLGRHVFNALYRLCGQSTKYVHCPELSRPVNDTTAWVHGDAYRVKQQELQGLYGMAKFCYFCYKWIHNDPSWQRHCSEHVREHTVRHDLLLFRRALARPGTCIFCWNEAEQSEERFKQFHHQTEWQRHHFDHVTTPAFLDTPYCPDRTCTAADLCSLPSLLDHFNDVHRVRFTPAQQTDIIHRKQLISAKKCSSSIRWITPYDTRTDEMVDLNITGNGDHLEGHIGCPRDPPPDIYVSCSSVETDFSAPPGTNIIPGGSYPELLLDSLDKILRGEQSSAFVDRLCLDTRAGRRARIALLQKHGGLGCDTLREIRHFLHGWFIARPPLEDRCELSLLRQRSVMDVINLVLAPEIVVFRITQKEDVNRDRAIELLDQS